MTVEKLILFPKEITTLNEDTCVSDNEFPQFFFYFFKKFNCLVVTQNQNFYAFFMSLQN